MPARRASQRSDQSFRSSHYDLKGAYPLKFVKKLCKVLFTVVAVLFVVYFWNLDQKVLGWAYKQVNLMFDQKKVDQVF